MNPVKILMTSLALTLLATGCADRNPGSAAAAPASSEAKLPSPMTDQWLGKWIGPEGTFLNLVGGNGTYEVTIQNLDGPRTFPARTAGDHIEFERDGAKESLRASNGVETGMKWLSKKTNCLTIRPGEGYCQD